MTTGHDLAMGLRAAYLLMHRQTNSFLAPFGMTADQFVLLSLLSDKDGITQQELTQRASSDPGRRTRDHVGFRWKQVGDQRSGGLTGTTVAEFQRTRDHSAGPGRGWLTPDC